MSMLSPDCNDNSTVCDWYMKKSDGRSLGSCECQALNKGSDWLMARIPLLSLQLDSWSLTWCLAVHLLPPVTGERLYDGRVFTNLNTGVFHASIFGSSFLASFSGAVVCRLVSFAVYLVSTYEWVHTMFIILSMGYFTQDGIF
ncbi:hypothetical protein STEG23_021827 [Scotinomys teguina]